MKVQVRYNSFSLDLESRSKEAHTLLNKKPELAEALYLELQKLLIKLDNDLNGFIEERRY